MTFLDDKNARKLRMPRLRRIASNSEEESSTALNSNLRPTGPKIGGAALGSLLADGGLRSAESLVIMSVWSLGSPNVEPT